MCPDTTDREVLSSGDIARALKRIAHEIVEQLGRVPDVVVAPVGGGGCLAGMATYFRGLSEDVTIVGVEPTGAVSLSAALVNGGPVTLAEIDPFVDGAAVKRIGTIGHRVLSEMGATVTDHPVLASITDVPGLRERTLTIHSLAKSRAFAGLRVGFLAASATAA